jgi:hypothetical protein
MTPARTAFAAACAACAVAASQAPERPQFRSAASGVRLVAWVLEDGQPVGNLRSEDFELRDNGFRQSVAVAEVQDGPLDVALVVPPASGSESALAAAHARFVHGRLRSDDTFEVVAARSGALAMASASAIGADASVQAGTTTVDASMAAVLRFGSGTEERLRVLMVLAGRDADDSWARAEDLSILAHRLNVVIVVGALADIGFDRIGAPGGGIVTYMRSGRDLGLVPSRPLRDLARSTGGGIVDLRRLAGQKHLGEVIQQLRTHYVLTYTPTGITSSGWHEIRLRVRGRRTVIVRSGYWGSEFEPSAVIHACLGVSPSPRC